MLWLNPPCSFPFAISPGLFNEVSVEPGGGSGWKASSRGQLVSLLWDFVGATGSSPQGSGFMQTWMGWGPEPQSKQTFKSTYWHAHKHITYFMSRPLGEDLWRNGCSLDCCHFSVLNMVHVDRWGEICGADKIYFKSALSLTAEFPAQLWSRWKAYPFITLLRKTKLWFLLGFDVKPSQRRDVCYVCSLAAIISWKKDRVPHMLFAAFEFKANRHVHFGGFDFSGHWQLNQYGTWYIKMDVSVHAFSYCCIV